MSNLSLACLKFSLVIVITHSISCTHDLNYFLFLFNINLQLIIEFYIVAIRVNLLSKYWSAKYRIKQKLVMMKPYFLHAPPSLLGFGNLALFICFISFQKFFKSLLVSFEASCSALRVSAGLLLCLNWACLIFILLYKVPCLGLPDVYI